MTPLATTDIAMSVGRKIRQHGLLASARKVLSILRREGVRGVARRLSLLQRRPQEASAASASPSVTEVLTRSGINLVGHPYGALGMGEHIRKSAHAFAAAGVPFVIFNTFNQEGPHGDKFPQFPYASRITREHPFPVSLFHMNADEMALASAHLGDGFFKDRYNIGYPAWELSKFPEAWRPALEFFDEIWAPSRFIQQAIADKFSGPVLHMPLAVGFTMAPELPRRHFGLPDKKFLFLFYFDFTSYVTRKNPFGPLAAFRRAFGDARRDNVALVIKLNGMEQRPDEHRKFTGAVGDRGDNVILIDRVMSDVEVCNLVRCCDCFVSLHRSEGFGRGIAEAMYYGKPVIATGYSGNTDFMHQDNACVVDYTLIRVKPGEYPHHEGQVWAEPDVEQAARYMRRLVDEPGAGSKIGARAAEYIHAHHGFDAVGERYRRRLTALGFMTST